MECATEMFSYSWQEDWSLINSSRLCFHNYLEYFFLQAVFFHEISFKKRDNNYISIFFCDVFYKWIFVFKLKQKKRKFDIANVPWHIHLDKIWDSHLKKLLFHIAIIHHLNMKDGGVGSPSSILLTNKPKYNLASYI